LAIGLTLYRIVQEALTNTLKHAGPCDVAIQLDYGGDALTVEVVDKSIVRRSRRDAGPSGHGLIGMRERAAAFGGTFSAGPSNTGWRVVVNIPRVAELSRETSGSTP